MSSDLLAQNRRSKGGGKWQTFRKEFHARDFLKFFLGKKTVFACFEKSNVLPSWHSVPKLNKPSKNIQNTDI